MKMETILVIICSFLFFKGQESELELDLGLVLEQGFVKKLKKKDEIFLVKVFQRKLPKFFCSSISARPATASAVYDYAVDLRRIDTHSSATCLLVDRTFWSKYFLNFAVRLVT